MSVPGNADSLQIALQQYVEIHDQIQAIKVQLKQLNLDFKARGTAVHQFLHGHPGNTCKVSEKHTVQLKSKTKASGLNTPLIGQGYIDFQKSHGRPNVSIEERDAFLGTLKELRKQKQEIVQDVHVLIT